LNFLLHFCLTSKLRSHLALTCILSIRFGHIKSRMLTNQSQKHHPHSLTWENLHFGTLISHYHFT
jgi:hypothetical protein